MNKFQVAPGLIAALDHFGTLRFGAAPVEAHCFVFRSGRGAHRWESSWTVEEACRRAHNVLTQENLAILKLRHLQAEMKRMGLHDLYERLMGEKLED